MTEYMLPPPSPRTLNPAVTPPSRATCFLPRFRIHSPAIISTTTIYFHSFNASEISEFSWREEIKIWMIRSLSLSLFEQREKSFRFLETFPFFMARNAWQGYAFVQLLRTKARGASWKLQLQSSWT